MNGPVVQLELFKLPTAVWGAYQDNGEYEAPSLISLHWTKEQAEQALKDGGVSYGFTAEEIVE